MQNFFLEKFDFDYSANIKWTKIIEENEDLIPSQVLKMMSHIINAHHIWISRLKSKQPESEVWDIFDVDYLSKLHMENLRATNDYIEKQGDLSQVIKLNLNNISTEFSISDVLYHVLNHSNYHRAQISIMCKLNEIEPQATNFISWARKV